MKTALCCIAKCENRYIKEFVEYYIKLGIDKIYIYDNNDIDGEHIEDALTEELLQHVVIIDIRGKVMYQINAYQHFSNCILPHYDWGMWFDCDEFLTINEEGFENDLKGWLSQERFNNYDVIHINWRIYDDNGLIYYEDKPCLERFTHPHMPFDFITLDNHPRNYEIKTIARGKCRLRWCVQPHYPLHNHPYCNWKGEPQKLSPTYFIVDDFDNQKVFLKHFQAKTIEEFITIKAQRGYPDANKDYFKHADLIMNFFTSNDYSEEKERVGRELIEQLNNKT